MWVLSHTLEALLFDQTSRYSPPPKTVKTETDGSFGIDKLVARPYRLVARAKQGVAGPVVARLNEKNDPVILTLKPAASVEFTIIDALNKQPIKGATVELREMCRDDCELLSAMGLTDRCRLRICRIGEPCIIQVAATRLGLSSTMASKIMVRPDQASN